MYKIHIHLTILGAKDFKCFMCGSTFTTNGSLSRHMAVHNTEGPYYCVGCQMTFQTAAQARKHAKTHPDVPLGRSCQNLISPFNSCIPVSFARMDLILLFISRRREILICTMCVRACVRACVGACVRAWVRACVRVSRSFLKDYYS